MSRYLHKPTGSKGGRWFVRESRSVNGVHVSDTEHAFATKGEAGLWYRRNFYKFLNLP